MVPHPDAGGGPVRRRSGGRSDGSTESHASKRPRAAGLEGAAGGQLPQVGRVARQARRRVARRRVADPRERRGQRVRVGVQRAAEDLVGGPCSTTRPAYITAIRSQRSASTDRSWLMISSPTPSSRDQPLEHVAAPGLHHHVEGGRRLVGDDQPRPAGQRHRDHHPLPLAAAELVGVGARPHGRQPDLLEQLADPAVDLAGRTAPARAAGSARRSGPRPAAPG